MFFALLIAFAFADADSDRQCVVNCARNQLGKPYVWGAEGPDSFDCSGLVMYCYDQCGHGFGYRCTTYTLVDEGVAVSESQLTIADLVLPSIEHVQIYSGNGYIIHAPQPGDVVKEVPYYGMQYGRRIIQGGSSGGGSGGGSAPATGTATVVVDALNVRSSPSTSSEVVAQYAYGQTFNYDSIVDGEGHKWFSYISWSGPRRYVCGRDSGGFCYTSPCP